MQEILKGTKFGRKHEMSNPNRPSNCFLKCEKCGGKLTGYEVTAKGLHYYKCHKCRGETINANTGHKRGKGEGTHELFIKKLESLQLPPHLIEPYKAQARLVFNKLSGAKVMDEQIISKELIKLQSDLKNLQRKYGLENLEEEVYLELKAELQDKIEKLNQQYQSSNLKSSNLEKCISTCADLSQNLSKYWASGGMDKKLKLQELIFPEGIVVDVKNRALRTKRMNMMFDITVSKRGQWETVNKNSQVSFTWESLLVAGG